MTTPEERPGRLGIFTIQNKNRAFGGNIDVEIPKEKIQSFILWLYEGKHSLVSTFLYLRPKNHDSLQYFGISFSPSIVHAENASFLEAFEKWCRENNLEMMDVEKDLRDAEEKMGIKVL